MNDNIADVLTRLRNANLVYMSKVSIPNTRSNQQIAKLLRQEGWISDVQIRSNSELTIRLKYTGGRLKNPAITGLRRISSPGRRVYVKYKEIPKILGGMGTALLSTSAGIMTDRKAREIRLGGELLCMVW